MKNFRKNQGITLIALVITIIVLIILAGVTINIVLDQNGIIEKTQEAKNETKQAEKDEKKELGKAEDIINQYLTGIEVEQVTDANPGALEGSGTETEPYVINSIEDLVFFAHDVTNGNSYEGEHVNLGLNLDFNSTKSYADAYRTDYGIYGYDGELKTLLTTGEGFKPIGTTFDTDISTNYFCGTFDGSYHTIYNMYQNVGNSDYITIIGLFSSNNGSIKKLKLENININATSNNIHLLFGGIAGRNYKAINQCFTSGEITIQANGIAGIYVGGIVGQRVSTESILNECASNVEINVDSSNTNEIVVAGIGPSYQVENCYYSGNILVTGSNSGFKNISGITGNSQEIINCYNTGKLESYFENENVGNLYISGIAYSGGSVQNCFNLRRYKM